MPKASLRATVTWVQPPTVCAALAVPAPVAGVSNTSDGAPGVTVSERFAVCCDGPVPMEAVTMCEPVVRGLNEKLTVCVPLRLMAPVEPMQLAAG